MEVVLHLGSIWTGHRDDLSFIIHKSLFLHFLHNGTKFYDKYITSDDRKKNIYDDGSGFFPKKRLESDTMQNIKRHIQIDIMFSIK